MGGNVLDDKDKYSQLMVTSLRKTAVLMTLYVSLYAVAAEFGIVASSPIHNPIATLLVISLMIASAIWIYTYRENTRKKTIQLFLIPFHAVSILSPTLITGFMSPLSVLCGVLVAITGILVSRIAMMFSAALLVLTAVIGIAVTPVLTVSIAVSHLVYAAIIIAIAWFINKIYIVQSAEHEGLIEEQMKRSDEQMRLLALINNINEAIISVNARGIIQFYNAATLSLLDTNQTLSGKRIDQVLATHSDKNESVTIMNILKAGGSTVFRDDLMHRFSDGESINLAISSSRVRNNDNKPQGYILIIRDITKDKSLDEERDEFISVVSHELRTPVTITEGTLSNLQLLTQKGAAPSVVNEALKVAHEQIIYLSRMINDLSTLSRAERGIGGEKEMISVTDLMRELYSEYQKKAADKQLALNLDASPSLGYVSASRLYLEEILQNFLTNAIKYTATGSVTLCAKQDKGTIEFAVRDTGIGIGKSEHDKIFDKFYRSEDYRTRETSGTGLGLYIVRKLSHKIGATIKVESRLNHGSTFSFELPLVQDPTAPTPDHSHHTPQRG